MKTPRGGGNSLSGDAGTDRNIGRIPSFLAKITPPTVRNALAREQIFERLGQDLDRRLIWISAPAGYGKTTVIVSFLRSRGITPIWYQCDESDGDIGAVFYYLGQAFRQFVDKPLAPEFSPEHLAGVPAFTRQFLRAWFTQLPRGFRLVFDNWQDLPASALLVDLLPVITDEIPIGSQVIVISRTDPAANLSRLESVGNMVVYRTADLQLSRAETAAIVAAHVSPSQQLSAMKLDELWAWSQGWAAGLTVMLRHEATPITHTANETRGPQQATFNLLSSQVFDRLNPAVRHFLVNTACLDHIAVPVAERITGNPDSRSILDSLVSQNSFTTYRPATDTYHYHPLLKEFLLTRLRDTLGAEAQRELLIAAAHSLLSEQDVEPAIGLLLQAREWQEAATLIAATAPVTAQHGRLQTLEYWIAALPADIPAASAWLSYWRGIVHMATDLPAARGYLEHAHALFTRDGEILGRMLAAAAILQQISFMYVDFRAMTPWIAELDCLLGNHPEFPAPAVELQIMTGLLFALSQVDPNHARLESCLARVTQLTDMPIDLPSKAAAIGALLHFYGMCGRTAAYRSLDGRVESLLQRPELGPAARIHILWMQAYHLFLDGADGEANALLERALESARHHNLTAIEVRLRISRMQTRDLRLPAEAFAAEFTALAPLLFRSPPILVAHARYLESMYALGNGNPAQALNLIEESKQVYEGTGWLVATAMLHIGTAEVLCALERFEEAESSLESADGLVAGLDCPILRFNGGLVRAEIARRSRTADEFLAALAQALSVGREQGFANGFTGYALLLPRLIPHALRANIEIAYCRSVIARRHLEPPLRDVPNWPWPVRIYAMGALEVLVEDVPLRFQGKAQRRPLDLLKLLLTQRLGIDNPRLMDTMWPDLDGDAARNAFDLTLHRLRKLLGHKDAILLTHGRLMLNPQQVWVDAFAIERLAIERAPGADLVETARDLLALYRGPFLGEDDTSALYLARARLRSQFVRAITELGEALRGQARWDLLVPTVQRAIEVEPLEEELHRSLIHSLIAQRHFTEADAAYRRCESIFARCLGRKPSPSTLHLVADRQFSEP